jgi:hypothetical protein
MIGEVGAENESNGSNEEDLRVVEDLGNLSRESKGVI